MGKLRNIDVKMLSLVREAANKKQIIYKNQTLNEEITFKIRKSSDELGVVYGIVYAPNEIDAHGDTTTPEEIRNAAYNFMKKSRLTEIVDVEHNMTPIQAFVCESWIVKESDIFKEVGAWAVGIKIEDENIRNEIKNGKITGISMYASAEVERKSLLNTIKDTFKMLLNNNEIKGVEEMNEEKIIEFLKLELEKLKEEIFLKIEELSRRVENTELELSKSKQNNEIFKSSSTGGIL